MKKLLTMLMSLILAFLLCCGIAATENDDLEIITEIKIDSAILNITLPSELGKKPNFLIEDGDAKKAYDKWYKSGGSNYYNAKSKVKTIESTNKLTFAATVALIHHNYVYEHGSTPELIGIHTGDIKTVSRWLQSVYGSDIKAGKLSEIIPGYPGVEKDIPLSYWKAIDTKVEYVYKIKGNYYVVSALVFHGKTARAGYDIGIELKKNGSIYVHFVTEMWNSILEI